jgi:hypothetical protein
MKHAPFLKVTSRELMAGRMVDVSSVSICRCGKSFLAEKDLEAHVFRPITDQIMAAEAVPEEPLAVQPSTVELAPEARLVGSR